MGRIMSGDKRGPGRPRNEYPADMERRVEGMAMIQCTVPEMAQVLGFSEASIRRDFDAAIKRGKDSGRMSLRRAQYKAAEAGNPTMLIWLGKQWLGQVDKQEIDHGNAGDGVFKVQYEVVARDSNGNGNGHGNGSEEAQEE
jgi:hypothetical protein